MLKIAPETSLTNRYRTAARVVGQQRIPREEENALIARAKTGDERAINWLVRSYLPMIINIANKYVRSPDARDDMIQCAVTGFIMSLRTYDPEKGILPVHAPSWIRKEIFTFIEGNSTLVIPPMAQRRIARALPKWKREMGIHDDLKPEEVESAAAALNANPEDIILVDRRNLRRDVALDQKITIEGDDKRSSLLDFFADDSAEGETDILDRLSLENRKNAFMEALGVLDKERDRDIIVQRFLTDPPITLEELGQKYNITRERIRQIEKQALRKTIRTMQKIIGRKLIIPSREMMDATFATSDAGPFSLLDLFFEKAADGEDAPERLGLESRKSVLTQALKLLNGRERHIFTQRFKANPMSLEQLARMYGISREGIVKIEKRAIHKTLDAMRRITGREFLMRSDGALEAAP